MARKTDMPAVSFSLNGGPEVKLSGAEFKDLAQRARKPKVGPVTKAQDDAARLLSDFVRRGLRGE